MRKFHNFIKKQYIDKYAGTGTRLLDLASGKGGDLSKWKYNANIKYIEGYDIDTSSVTEAKKRLKALNIKKPVFFTVKDLSKEAITCNEPFDLITSYFAFHYFFKTPKTLKCILDSILHCSKKDSILVLTLFDATILENIEDSQYSVKLEDNFKRHSEYSRKLDVYIKDSVLDTSTTEYAVRPNFLIKKLKGIGFELLETKLFSEIDTSLFKLSDSEKRLSFLNRIYVFKKIKD